MTKPLEAVLDELYDREVPPSVEECVHAILPYMKKVKDWPSVLRQLADYIEASPKPLLLNPRTLMGYILAAMKDEEEKGGGDG